MAAALAGALSQARRARGRHIGALAELIRIPSVSSDPGRRREVARAAAWLARRLGSIGLAARLLPPREAPIVFASWRAVPGRPTLLIYGHYDVVAPEPLAAWHKPPFAPTITQGFIHGRGSSDDKGPVVCHLTALEAWLRSAGRLPLNVICVFEGQEEIGSPGLLKLLTRRPPGLHADAVVVSDTRMIGPGRPTLIYGLRGSLSAELRVRTAALDLHSGAFGGAVRNAADVLCELVTGLHDRQGRITLPGFYRRVLASERPPAELDRPLLRAAGIPPGAQFGEAGFSAHERTTSRPALDVNGLVAGHTGSGGKSIVPGSATAKLSFRLVPDQDPSEVARQLRRHIAALTPVGVSVEVRIGKQATPYLGDPGDAVNGAAAEALTASFGRAPVALRSGGSIPVVEAFARALDAPVALMGFASPDDGMHAANERFSLDSFARGTEACVRFLDHVAAALTAPRERVRVPA